MNSQELRNLQEAYIDVYDNIMEKEDSPYEKASDAALDARYGYGRASGDKRSFGRAANRSSAAAALRAIRRGERSGSGTSREAGADAVHRGWADTARTSTDQTPEKKERRAGLANTPYSNLPDDEKEKDRVSFDAVRATYNRNKTQKEEFDIYDIILSHLIDEGYADTEQAAEAIMVNMSEDWRESIVEQASTVASSGGAGGKVTADKQYPATLRGLKGVKSTDSKGTEYFQPYTSSGRREPSGKPFEPTTMPDANRAQYKQSYSGKYENIPASQSTKNPQSHLFRTGVPRVRSATSTYGID